MSLWLPNAFIFFSLLNALDRIRIPKPNTSFFFHKDMNLFLQWFPSFSAPFPFSVITPYCSSHSKAEKDGPTTSSPNILTGKNSNNSTPAGPAQKPGSFSWIRESCASGVGASQQFGFIILVSTRAAETLGCLTLVVFSNRCQA